MYVGEHHVKMGTEIRVMILQAKECLKLPANHQKSGERHGAEFKALEGINLADTFSFLVS